MTPNLVSSAVLPLCWPLQADQLQRDQTGVHGPPHLLHWPWSSKYIFCQPEWRMGNTAGLNICCCCCWQHCCLYILHKNLNTNNTIFEKSWPKADILLIGCHIIHKWWHIYKLMRALFYHLHSHWHVTSFETVLLEFSIFFIVPICCQRIKLLHFCYRIWKL